MKRLTFSCGTAAKIAVGVYAGIVFLLGPFVRSGILIISTLTSIILTNST